MTKMEKVGEWPFLAEMRLFKERHKAAVGKRS